MQRTLDGVDPHLRLRADQLGGVFTAKDLADFGIPHSQVRRWIASGDVVTRMRGGYGLPLSEPDPWGILAHLQRTRVALRLEPTSAAAHLSALVAYRVDLLNPELATVHLGRPGPVTPSHRPQIARHLIPPDTRVHAPQGVRAVDIRLALAQYGCASSHEAAVCAVDSAVHRELTTLPDLAETFAGVPRNQGPRRLARVLADADAHAESVGETRTRLLLAADGYRLFSQVAIAERGAVFAAADLQIVGTRVLIEYDGEGKYDQPGALVTEKRREDRIRRLGYLMVRAVRADLSSPSRFLAEVRDRIATDARASSRREIGPCRYPARRLIREPHICTTPHPT